MKWHHPAALVLVFLTTAIPGRGMGFCCPPRTPTARQLASTSKVILVGVICQTHEDGQGGGTTEFHISQVLKSDPVLGEKKIVHLPLILEQPTKEPHQLLLFADVFQGQLDVFDEGPVTPEFVDYLRRAMTLGDRDPVGLLRYYFDYLQDADETIARDAHHEFDEAEKEDIIRAAKTFSPRKPRAWLRDPKTSPRRLHLYGLLLGHCGDARDAVLLGRLARKVTASEPPSLMDGVLTGYTLLAPREGWALVRQRLGDESKPFMVRYMALRTVRYMHDLRPDPLAAKELVEALALLLDQEDIADIAIEDLRKWHCWEMADRILALDARPSHDLPIVHRSILRFALQCPGAKAAAFVAATRKRDPQQVADAEELLQLEQERNAEIEPAAKGVQ